MLTKYNVNMEEWYPADEVDKELSALSDTELVKENTRLRLELQEKKEDIKAGEDIIVELRAKIKQFALCYEVQPEECYKHCDILKEKDAQIWNYQKVIKENEKQQLALMKQINDTDKQFKLLRKYINISFSDFKDNAGVILIQGGVLNLIEMAQRGELR